MGLNLAVKAHGDGDLTLAETHYKRAYQQGDDTPVYYQNYGALLRSTDRLDEAIELYDHGLRKFPNNLNISLNYANAVRSIKSSRALQIYLSVFKHFYFEDPSSKKTCDAFLNVCSLLYEKGLYQWNLEILRECIPWIGLKPGILQNLLLLIDKITASDDFQSIKYLKGRLENVVQDLPDKDSISIRFSLFQHYLNLGNYKNAICQFDLANECVSRIKNSDNIAADDLSKIYSNVEVNYWNGSCTLLKLQDFKRGWPMFDYGLRAPCPGPQRWQRSLAKPFPSESLALWKGQPLNGKKLLLLDEQGIGDSMMFLTLVPRLLFEAAHIGLFLPDRLISVYKSAFTDDISKKSLAIYSKSDFYDKKFSSSDFDFQSPLGSICRYRFTHPNLFSPRVPILKCNEQYSKQLRSQYLSSNDNLPLKLIGVSWRGGGRSGRVRQKSVDIDQFAKLIKNVPGVRFVSLQYGESKSIVDRWRQQGIDIIHDDQINPLKDVFSWLSQVNACDAVLSVANTTIHGSGGLNIPTQCLLSKHSDWRWLSSQEIMRSYWYPSVGICREHPEKGWDNALLSARNWLLAGAPMPDGVFYHDSPPMG